MASNVDRNVSECVFTIARALQVTVQGCLTPKASFCTPPSNNCIRVFSTLLGDSANALFDTWTVFQQTKVVLRCPGVVASGVTHIMKTVLLFVFAAQYRRQLLYHVTLNSVAMQPKLALRCLIVEACRPHTIIHTYSQ